MRRGTILMLTLLAGPLAAGCLSGQVRDPLEAQPPPPETGGKEARYLAEPPAPGPDAEPAPTAVEKALAWSEKYARAVEDLNAQVQDNHRLAAQNRELSEKLARAQHDLEAARAELQEANELMMDLRAQLQQWKTNVLGFREEMREAHQAQLEAMIKVLTLLGGELPQPEAEAAAAEPAPTPPAEKETDGEPAA